jgi:hypothetical protein
LESGSFNQKLESGSFNQSQNLFISTKDPSPKINRNLLQILSPSSACTQQASEKLEGEEIRRINSAAAPHAIPHHHHNFPDPLNE